MALKRVYKKRLKGVNLVSGHVYSFQYSSWINDPKPTIILLYAVEGIHPRTGHQHRYLQGLNFTYIPRNIRRKFIREWINILNTTNGNAKLTWEKVKARYPYMQHSIRRYSLKPEYLITKLKEVPIDDLEKVVVSSFSKDFSKKIKVSLINKFRNVMGKRRKGKRRK